MHASAPTSRAVRAALREQLVDTVRGVLAGMDRDTFEDDDGWWSTSVGADFGASKLVELERALDEFVFTAVDDFVERRIDRDREMNAEE